jgi:hypothetical protein
VNQTDPAELFADTLPSWLSPRPSNGVPVNKANPNTITHRSIMRLKNVSITNVSARSMERMNSVRPQTTQARHQGISKRQNPANSVPIALARREFLKSPCISKAKLVVMPHDGHGRPVVT